MAKKEIRKSYEVNGEIDMVKPSPRQPGGVEKQQIGNKVSGNNKNEIKLTQDQLIALINAIKANEKRGAELETSSLIGGGSNSLENLNLNLSDNEGSSGENHNNKRDMSLYKTPNVAFNGDNGSGPTMKPNGRNDDDAKSSKKSLIEKKKQKWMNEKGGKIRF